MKTTYRMISPDYGDDVGPIMAEWFFEQMKKIDFDTSDVKKRDGKKYTDRDGNIVLELVE